MPLNFPYQLRFVERGDIIDTDGIAGPCEEIGKRVRIQLWMKVERKNGSECCRVRDWRTGLLLCIRWHGI